MEISRETFRAISRDFAYSEDALRRHRENHLAIQVADVHATMEQAREKALAEAKERALEEIKEEAADSMASRLQNAASFLDQLREVRNKAASFLDLAECAGDLRSAGMFLKELREQIRLWAELEGKLASQPQINVINNPEWVELRTLIIKAIEPYPEAKEAVIHAIRER